MPGKVSIVGAGSVGSATAFALAMDGTPNEIVLIDLDKNKAQGEMMDISHGAAFMPRTEMMGTNDFKHLQGSDIIIIAAGVAQKKGETRLDLIAKNRSILKSIIKEVKRYAKDSILLVVTNPVDVLTYFARFDSGFPPNRVFGTGTVLDSARFRSYLAKKFKVNAHNVHAYVMGEHGDSSFPVLESAHIASVPLSAMPGYKKSEIQKIHKKVVTVVYDVIKKKGSTNLAIAICVRELVRAILNDTHEIFPVSSVLHGEYGIKGVAVSTPSVLGKKGIERELVIPLGVEEKKKLKKSVSVLKKAIKDQKK